MGKLVARRVSLGNIWKRVTEAGILNDRLGGVLSIDVSAMLVELALGAGDSPPGMR
jgi:hypothetical protein